MTGAVLHVEGISKRYRPADPLAVSNVSFEVAPGEVFALLGPSGCGKTTTLRIIAGFEKADAGEVRFGTRHLTGTRVHVPPEKRGIGFVFQDYALFPHLSVRKNVSFGLKHLRRNERRARSERLVESLGLTEFASRKPGELSGGQQQRAALARSIAPAPKLVLLDEPFSNLDAQLRKSARTEVRTILKDNRLSAILVTHDQEEALAFADRIGVMRNAQLEQVGDAEEVYRTPRTEFVARFLGNANVFRVNAAGRSASGIIGNVPLDRDAHGETLIGLRPEQIDILPTTDGVPGHQIVGREFQGASTTYRVQAGETVLVVQVSGASRFEVGAEVALRPREPAVVLQANDGTGQVADTEP